MGETHERTVEIFNGQLENISERANAKIVFRRVTNPKSSNIGFLGEGAWGSHSRHILKPFLPKLDQFGKVKFGADPNIGFFTNSDFQTGVIDMHG